MLSRYQGNSTDGSLAKILDSRYISHLAKHHILKIELSSACKDHNQADSYLFCDNTISGIITQFSYVINQNDDLMTDAVPTIDPLADNYNMYDITLYKSGEAVQPDAKIKVMIPIPAGYDKSRIAVYWYKEDGTLEKMNATVNGSYAIFETDHLSYYVLVEEHVHTYGEDDETCTDCGFDRTEGCGCNCHKNGIAKFFFNFILFFQKIFKANKICKCGINHY